MCHTNVIEGEWAHLKSFLKARFGVRRERFDEWLAECVFFRQHKKIDERKKTFFKHVLDYYGSSLEERKKQVELASKPMVEVVEKKRENAEIEFATPEGFEFYEDLSLRELEEMFDWNNVGCESESDDGPEYYIFEEEEVKECVVELKLLSPTDLVRYGIEN